MSEDRVFLFGVLAVRRKLLTQEQLDELADQPAAGHELDEALVRSGLLTDSDRQKVWAEIERLEKKYSGDVSRIIDAIRSGPGESTFDAQHTSTADTGANAGQLDSEEDFDDQGATVIAHREETVNAPPRMSPPPDFDNSANESPGTNSDSLNPHEQTSPFEETVISKDESSVDKDSDFFSESDDVFEQTIESRVDPDAGMLQTIDRGSSAADAEAKETVGLRAENSVPIHADASSR
jgi:hypothetical protein